MIDISLQFLCERANMKAIADRVMGLNSIQPELDKFLLLTDVFVNGIVLYS